MRRRLGQSHVVAGGPARFSLAGCYTSVAVEAIGNVGTSCSEIGCATTRATTKHMPHSNSPWLSVIGRT